MKKWGMMLAAGIVLAGCSEQADTGQSQDRTVTVQADELFKGELKTLQPHLRIQGGAVILDEPSDVAISFDMWQNGKKKSDGARLLDDPEQDIKDITFSIQPDPDNPKEQLITMACNGNETSVSSSIDGMPDNMTAFWAADFIEEDGMVIQPGERKAIWGYGASAGSETSASTEESIQNADWGLIIYIEAAK